MIKWIISLIFSGVCVLVPWHSKAQTSTGDYVTALYMNSVVQITRGDTEYGFGVIVSQDNGKLYIVTANHVVRNYGPDASTMSVYVRFYHDQKGVPVKAELLDLVSDIHDLALLRVNIPANLNWLPKNYCDANQQNAYQPNDRAWFIGRAQKWFVPKDIEAGVIGDTPDFKGMLRYATSSVEVGTSGAPLISKKGLIGIITEDDVNSVQAVDVAVVRKFVEKEGDYPWQLVLSCEEKLPTLTIIPNIDNARIYLNDVLNGEFNQSSPFQKKLQLGDYNVYVKKEGYESFKQTVNLGEDKKVIAKLKPMIRAGLTTEEQAQALYEWQNDIRYSSSSWTVEGFLKRYPTGSHVPDVKRKLEELRAHGR
ncbi:trypsin-like peptidase domain-containing protein [Candidatus Venteria ishoeyi]|uniref:trypsin-like peptidase domain-containing protein n=1 Tax=Candidatus Venteria ishoeyi TaxID=1899563 RepID=UPI0025A5DB07|nr:trypsin-like peptidase domain-containing protein [Candidatus Venteria ishoeyi]MDM8547930.1 trypsin-like peptidase domain-containing protein [Candidatus Venteria ishoeyi]